MLRKLLSRLIPAVFGQYYKEDDVVIANNLVRYWEAQINKLSPIDPVDGKFNQQCLWWIRLLVDNLLRKPEESVFDKLKMLHFLTEEGKVSSKEVATIIRAVVPEDPSTTPLNFRIIKV